MFISNTRFLIQKESQMTLKERNNIKRKGEMTFKIYFLIMSK